MFGTVLTAAYTAFLAYIVWRAGSVPLLAVRLSRKRLVAIGFALWIVFFLGRTVGHDGTGIVATLFESVGMSLLGWVFCVAIALFAVDIGTVFGRVFLRWTPILRGWGMVAGTILCAVAVVQALRAPAVASYEVNLRSLPAAADGTILVAVSDAHLGSQLGEPWFAARVREIQALRPDVVVFLGDMFEGHGAAPHDIPALRQLNAPLGKWFVDGNHELMQEGEIQAPILESSGFRHLANRWAEVAPGLVLAGVTDLTNHQRRGRDDSPLELALAHRPGGATVLLSHTPWQADRAAHAGVDLMLSGHTHGGQIWPFGYLVKTVYPYLAGRYDVEGMPLVVSRGVGTWGPRMRLWHRGEIVMIKLRAGHR